MRCPAKQKARDANAALKFGPARFSITKYGAPSVVSPCSSVLTIWGWFDRQSDLAFTWLVESLEAALEGGGLHKVENLHSHDCTGLHSRAT